MQAFEEETHLWRHHGASRELVTHYHIDATVSAAELKQLRSAGFTAIGTDVSDPGTTSEKRPNLRFRAIQSLELPDATPFAPLLAAQSSNPNPTSRRS